MATKFHKAHITPSDALQLQLERGRFSVEGRGGNCLGTSRKKCKGNRNTFISWNKVDKGVQKRCITCAEEDAFDMVQSMYPNDIADKILES